MDTVEILPAGRAWRNTPHDDAMTQPSIILAGFLSTILLLQSAGISAHGARTRWRRDVGSRRRDRVHSPRPAHGSRSGFP